MPPPWGHPSTPHDGRYDHAGVPQRRHHAVLRRLSKRRGADGNLSLQAFDVDAAAANPKPGSSPFQRLNRAEYAASVRALLGLEVDVGPARSPSSCVQYSIYAIKFPTDSGSTGVVHESGVLNQTSGAVEIAGVDFL